MILLSEIVIAVGLIVLVHQVLDQKCWPRRLVDRGPIVVEKSYFVRKSDDTVALITQGEYSGITDWANKIGIQVKLNRQCYCQDLYADVVPFRVVAGIWLETKLGGVRLDPTERNGSFVLEGPWSPLPPTDRYKVELHLKCAEHPDPPLKKIDFATFTKP
jgi:hypothetical protein